MLAAYLTDGGSGPEALACCLSGALSGWMFPEPTKGAVLVLERRFDFKPVTTCINPGPLPIGITYWNACVP